MRRSSEWMEQLDERILEHVADRGWGSPPIVHRELTMTTSVGRIRDRCQVLSDVGYLAPIVEGTDQYELTGSGKRYLDGESDANQVKSSDTH